MGINSQTFCGLAAVTAVIVGALVYLKFNKEKKENYSSSAFTNIGTFTDLGANPTIEGTNYDMMKNYGTDYNPFYPNISPYDHQVSNPAIEKFGSEDTYKNRGSAYNIPFEMKENFCNKRENFCNKRENFCVVKENMQSANNNLFGNNNNKENYHHYYPNWRYPSRKENYDPNWNYSNHKEGFGEYFDGNANNELPNKNWNEQQTIQRLDRIDDKLLPKVSKNVTPYNVNIADPIAYTYQIHAPRVIRRDRIAMEADPMRGDIPISIYPDIPVVERSQYGRDSLRLDGTFSDAFAAQYKRLTGGAYFNEPSYNTYGSTLMS